MLLVSTATLLTGYVEVAGGSGFQEGMDRKVFTLELTGDNNATWTFTLFDQLDHVDDGTDTENVALVTDGAPVDAIDF